MLYCGATSLNRQDNKESALQSEVTVKHITADFGNNSKTLLCRTTPCNRSAQGKHSESVTIIPLVSISEIFRARDNIISIQFISGNSVFSRPPPISL